MEGKGIGIIKYGKPNYDNEEAKPKIMFSVRTFEDIQVTRHSSYTVYPLRVETSYKQWIVKHRYSAYLDLHKYLSKKHKSMNLPKFPTKKVFKQDKSVKEDRKSILNSYFKGLYHIFNVELLYDDKVCKFIQIDQSIRNYLSEDYSAAQRNYDDEDDESSSRSNSADFLADCPPDKEVNSDKVICSFLNKIHKHPENKVNILKVFEDSFFNLKISLEIDSIKRLFFGDARNGLLKMASDKNESYLVSSHVVSLIAKLLDIKRNVYAESFNKIFATCKPDMIKGLNLDQHILNQQKTGEDNNGCFIIYNYINHKNLGGVKIELDRILSSQEAIEDYESWQDKKQLK